MAGTWVDVWILKTSHWWDHHLLHAMQPISLTFWSGCWLWRVEFGSTPLQLLCKVWQELEHAVQSILNMLIGWHVRWVCWSCTNWDVSVVYMGRWIIMLQHEVVVENKWHNNGTRDLVIASLCIQNAHDKMHLCLMSMTYTCPYHNPAATVGHYIHNIDNSKPFTHTMPRTHTWSGLNSLNWDSSVRSTPLQCAGHHQL